MPAAPEFHDRLLSLGLARVTEAAAIACAPLIGRGDEKAADQAAVDAMRRELGKLDVAGVVVIGEGERDEAPGLPPSGGPVAVLVHDGSWRHGWDGRRSGSGWRSRPLDDLWRGRSVAQR